MSSEGRVHDDINAVAQSVLPGSEPELEKSNQENTSDAASSSMVTTAELTNPAIVFQSNGLSTWGRVEAGGKWHDHTSDGVCIEGDQLA